MGTPINHDQIERANEIFCEALDLPPEERASFVRKRCEGQNDGLGESVLRLLSRYGRLGDFLEQPPWRSGTDALAEGEILGGRFRISSLLGRGGMGEVYRAEDRVAVETVALKVLRPREPGGEQLAERFRNEIRAARRISHPHICRVNELFEEVRSGERLLFFSMQFLDGRTLAARISEGPIEPAPALELARQIAGGLDAAHQAGIVHRDLKPANVMLVKAAGGEERAVITDFGLAKGLSAPASDGQTVAGTIAGTPDYMAPEQFLGQEISARTDVYAFALLIHEMVAGRKPFPKEDVLRSAVRRTLDRPEPLRAHNRTAPPSWTAILERSLSADPRRRHPSAGALVGDLAKGLDGKARITRRMALYASGAVGLAGIAGLLRLRDRETQFPTGETLLMLTPTRAPLQDGSQGVTTAHVIDLLLANQLQQSAHVQLLPRERMEQAWERMRGTGGSLPLQMEPATAREIALRTGAPFVLFGALTRISDEFRLDLNLDLMGGSPRDARKTWRQTLTARQEADLSSTVREGANWVRSAMREPDAELNRRDRAPAELTTASWQALVEYTQAIDAWGDRSSGAALQHLRSALDLDPDFALAGARMADLLDSLDRYDEGLPYYSRAAAAIARKNLTDRESLHIRGLFALDTGQLKEADAVFARWCLEYPHDGTGYFYRSTSTDLLGFHEQALQLIQTAIDYAPSSYSFLVRRALLEMDAGRLEEAEADYRRAAASQPSDWSDQLSSGLRFARLDMPGVWKALENMRAEGSALYRGRAYNFEACLRAEQGRWEEAENLLRAGVDADGQLGAEGRRALFTKRRLLVQLLLNRRRTREAVELCAAMLKEKPGYREKMQVGCLLAQAGEIAGARGCVVGGLPAWQLYTHWVKRLQGEIALQEGRAAEAVESMLAAGAPSLKNEWRWYLARAAKASGRRDVLRDCVSALLANPGGFWVQADAAGPGFVSWALGATQQCDLQPAELARATALHRALS